MTRIGAWSGIFFQTEVFGQGRCLVFLGPLRALLGSWRTGRSVLTQWPNGGISIRGNVQYLGTCPTVRRALLRVVLDNGPDLKTPIFNIFNYPNFISDWGTVTNVSLSLQGNLRPAFGFSRTVISHILITIAIFIYRDLLSPWSEHATRVILTVRAVSSGTLPDAILESAHSVQVHSISSGLKSFYTCFIYKSFPTKYFHNANEDVCKMLELEQAMKDKSKDCLSNWSKGKCRKYWMWDLHLNDALVRTEKIKSFDKKLVN